MVEVAVALAAAQAAVAGIKQAIQVGRDAKECLGEFMQLFDAQDQIQKASTEERAKLPPEKQKSAMSEALETVIAAKKQGADAHRHRGRYRRDHPVSPGQLHHRCVARAMKWLAFLMIFIVLLMATLAEVSQ